MGRKKKINFPRIIYWRTLEMKKRLLVSLSAAAVLSVSSVALVNNNVENTPTVVQAATYKKKLTKNAYIYNAKGKRVGKKVLKKGKLVKILGRKTIKGKKYYKIGKNKYVRTANFVVKFASTNTSSTSSYNTGSSSTTNNGFTKSSTKGEFPTSNSVHAKTSTSSTTSKTGSSSSTASSKSSGVNTNDSEYVGDPNKSNIVGDNSSLLSTRWRSTFYGPMTAKEDANRKKYGYKHVYFSDNELQRLEKRLWQDIQKYRESKGYTAFKTNAELTNLAQQAQVPGTAAYNRFSFKISQNTNDIKTFLPNLAAKGLNQAIGYVDPTAYGENHKALLMGGDITHNGRTPEQAADAIFKVLKESDDFQSKMIYGWKEYKAYGALSVHYYYDKQAIDGSAVGISFFTVDGTSPEWISAWNNAN